MNFKVCACMHICVCLSVCFDKVHDEHMHECVTVVMPVYANKEKMHWAEHGGVSERVCKKEFHVCVHVCSKLVMCMQICISGVKT